MALKSMGLLLCVLIAGCGDECSKNSDFSCKEIQNAPYNVVFALPDGTQQRIGLVKGLSECGDTARRFAHSKNLLQTNDWGYVCCMQAKGSQCYEKHR